MNQIPLQKLHDSVTTTIRKRGAEYAHYGRVRITQAPSAGFPLTAIVSGSHPYQVTIRYDDRILFASCDCPYFDRDLDICKHIWAVLVHAEEKKLSFGGAVDDLFADDEPYFDDFAEEDDEDEDEEDDDEDEDEAKPDNVVDLRRPTGGRQISRTQWKPPPPPSRWRSQVSSLSSTPYRDAEHFIPGSEIIYVLNVLESSGSLRIDIALRTPKKNGELSKPRNVRLTSSDLARITDPLDREILAMVDSSNRSHYGSLGIEPQQTIGWPGAEYLVPRMVETGRFWIKLPTGEYETKVVFDGGEPWRLVVSTELHDGHYVVTGNLRRGDATLKLSDVLTITRGGFVVTRSSIARFADDGSHAWATMLRRESIEIPHAEAHEFVRAVVTSKAPPSLELPEELRWNERFVKPLAILDIRFTGYDSTAQASASFDYDGASANAFVPARCLCDDATRTLIVRDAAEELSKLNVLWRNGFSRNGETISIARSKLGEAIPRLIEGGWEVRGAEGIHRGFGELELAVTSGIDWFDLEATATFGNERIRLPRLLAAMRKGEMFVRLDDGSLGMIPEQWQKQLEPFLAAAAEENEGGFRFRRNQVLLLDALLATRPLVQFDELFDNARRKILDVRVIPEEAPRDFKGRLRSYQNEGLGWFSFLRELQFGGCLADDMGLGKTIQVLALLEQRRTQKKDAPRPSLVVVPRSLIFNWKLEAARFTPEIRVLDYSAPDRLRETKRFDDYDVVLTTYAILRIDAGLFAETDFDYAILDEAQAIKNPSSQSAKAAQLIRAHHRLALSGTPVENHLGELGSLFEFLNPGMLRGKSSRMSTLLRSAGKKTDEAFEARTMLARAVRPFILRRTKSQVARELPDRVEQTIYCDLGPKQRKLYDELRDYYRASLLGRIAANGMSRSKMHVLEALLRLRQAACHPGLVDSKRVDDEAAKLETLFEELPIILDENHKVLVFSQFTSMLAIVQRQLAARGIPYAYLDGKTRDRDAQVRLFQEDPDTPLFLISLKAGGLGLNLTAADYVFLLDPWWNPAAEAQAIDRAHRIGQTRSVFAYRLVARDTIEEKILMLQQNKRALADAIISEENSVLRQLTPEDLEILLA